jgi:MATE family multidrug resistance protein
MLRDPDLLSDNQRVGYRRLFFIALPLTAQMLSYSLMTFIDRIFMSSYDATQFAAVLPSGMLGFGISAFFYGIVWFVGTLVAQYYGAGQRHHMTRAMWQGIWFSVFSSFLLIGLIPVVPSLFTLFKHKEDIIEYEKIYLTLMLINTCFGLFAGAISGLFSGIGKTSWSMYGSLVGNLTNIVLDYIFIFGKFGSPEMGIFGAGLATVIGSALNMLTLMLLAVQLRKEYPDILKPSWDTDIMKRLLRFGTPSSMQMTIDALGFTVLLLFMGQYPTYLIAAASITFSLQSFAYMPMVGIASGMALIVGQERGAERLHNIHTIIRRGMLVAMGYTLILVIFFIGFPQLLLGMFSGLSIGHTDKSATGNIITHAIPMLKIAAAWLIFDTLYNVFMQALKALGDTIYIMLSTAIAIIITVIIPGYLFIRFNSNILWFMSTIIFFTFALSVAYAIRYYSGAWKNLHVIDEHAID